MYFFYLMTLIGISFWDFDICSSDKKYIMFIFIQPLEKIMMETRDPLEWHFKQLDHAMGLSFKANFNFALVGHLLKGGLLTKQEIN